MHLLLAGPLALAVHLGAALNGVSPVTMPLWDGSAYTQTLQIS